jgi:hypothetical protein
VVGDIKEDKGRYSSGDLWASGSRLLEDEETPEGESGRVVWSRMVRRELDGLECVLRQRVAEMWMWSGCR